MKRTTGEYIIDCLINHGIEYIIGIPGHGCLSFFDALRDRASKGKIKYIQVKQEMSAVHMADGYYRACGKPLAVFTSIGAGALNTAIGIATSFVDSTPVLMFMGDTHTHMKGAGILQEIERKEDSDILSVFRPITKKCWRIESELQVPSIMRRAFGVMSEGRKGPVVISMPMDIQARELDAADETETAPIRLPEANPSRIDAALDLMEQATRPVILLGGGALYANSENQLIDLAESWGAAVITTMAGKGVFPEDHPLYGWHGGSKGTEAGNYLCRTADVILALGCRFSDETTSSYREGSTFNLAKTKLIHVDIDGKELGKNYPCTLAINADLKSISGQLAGGLKARKIKDYKTGDYFADIQRAKQAWFEKLKTKRAQAGNRLTISGILHEINAVYPEDGFIVVSSGNSQAQVFQEYCFRKPHRLITTGGFSTMGFALPAALGVKLAHKEKKVLAIAGDGDFMMTMQEMSIARQYDIPVIILVCNNSGWMAIRDLQIDAYGEKYDFGNYFKTQDGLSYTPDFSAAASAFGLYSERVTKKDVFPEAFKRVLGEKGPSLIEVMVSDEYPYSGGEATGWWDVPVPAYIEDKAKEYGKNVREEYLCWVNAEDRK